MVVWPTSSSVNVGAWPTKTPSVVFDVPKSSPQAAIIAPRRSVRLHTSRPSIHHNLREFSGSPDTFAAEASQGTLPKASWLAKFHDEIIDRCRIGENRNRSQVFRVVLVVVF